MKVKKYTADTMQKAMQEIRKEFGVNAVILNSRTVKQGGFFGWFKKSKIEVVAAFDPHPTHNKEKKINKQPIKSKEIKKKVQPLKTEKTTEDLFIEIQNMKSLLKTQNIKSTAFPEEFGVLYHYLVEQEVDEVLAHNIVDEILEKYDSKKEEMTRQLLYEEAYQSILSRLEKQTYTGVSLDKQIVQFVGPTGVGKTTTIAKIASFCMFKKGKKVAFITTDTYRIAAIEQLKTYARILDIPVEVAYNLDDYNNAVGKFTDYDLIFVDTAGRNFKNEKYIEDLKYYIKSSGDVETFLVMSMTAKTRDMADVYKRFLQIPIKELIFTKLDETQQYGNMLNIMVDNNIGLAYITDGQDVPDDIIQPSPDKITSYILGDFYEV